MASENVENWDEPLSVEPTPPEEEVTEDYEEMLRQANLERLQDYVRRMVYRPIAPKSANATITKLAKPKKVILLDNYNTFRSIYEPKQRSRRMKRNTAQYTAITAEQFENILRDQKAKEHQKEELQRQKQEIFCELLSKLERQCRTQYLNVFIKKFANFIAKLATTMRIPPELIEPYARMQRGIFCNILLAIGTQPQDPAAMYYNNPQAQQFEVCHKLAHALLSLVIKALDTASTKCPADIKEHQFDTTMDNYIKDRLMCAAEKKVLSSRRLSKIIAAADPILETHKKCQYDAKNL